MGRDAAEQVQRMGRHALVPAGAFDRTLAKVQRLVAPAERETGAPSAW